MVVRWPLLGLLICFVFSDNVSGYCFKDPIKFERTVSGRVRKYCEYKHPPVVNKDAGYIIMFPDSSVFTGDCLACTCTMEGLTCCGFGHQEINFNLPQDCIQLQDGCHGLHVKRSNNSLDCFTGKPISFDTLEPHPDNVFSLPSLVESGSTKVIKVAEAAIKRANKTLQTRPITTPIPAPTVPITVTPTTPQPTIEAKPAVEKQIIPTVQIPTKIATTAREPVTLPEIKTTAVKQEPTPAPAKVVDLGIVPVIQPPKPSPPKGDNRFITLDMLKNGIFSLTVPQKKAPILPTTRPSQTFLLPINNFNRQSTNQIFTEPSTQNNMFASNTFGRSNNMGGSINRRQQYSVNPYVTATPPPFYPVPYMDPAPDTREDSSSNSNYLFNDLLFNMMLFGAFA